MKKQYIFVILGRFADTHINTNTRTINKSNSKAACTDEKLWSTEGTIF